MCMCTDTLLPLPACVKHNTQNLPDFFTYYNLKMFLYGALFLVAIQYIPSNEYTIHKLTPVTGYLYNS